MVRLILGKYGSGKLLRAEHLSEISNIPSVIYDLPISPNIDFIHNLHMKRTKNVYLLAESLSDLKPEFRKFVDEIHVKNNGFWKVYKVKHIKCKFKKMK